MLNRAAIYPAPGTRLRTDERSEHDNHPSVADEAVGRFTADGAGGGQYARK